MILFLLGFFLNMKHKNFYIDVRTKTFHLIYDEKEKCEDLKGIKRKYIQETTAKFEAILNNNEFMVCQKCNSIVVNVL